MAPSSPPNDCDTLQSTGPVKTKSRRPNYRRRVKPPHSFAELITMAIKESQSGKLTLREIQNHMSASYECFRGSYVGWKNSVRHNLSTCLCFVKVLKNEAKPNGKDNFWALNLDCPHCVMLKARNSSHQPRGTIKGIGAASRNFHKSSPAPRPATQGVATPSAHTRGNPTAPSIAQPTSLPATGQLPSRLSSAAGSSAASAASHPSNEWNLPVSGLYVPDGEIDLSLYSDDAWVNWESRQNLQTPTGQFYQERQQDLNPKASSAYMESGNYIYPPHRPLPVQGAPPSSAPYPQPAKITIKSEYVAASRYHPYDARHSFGSFRRDRSVDYSCYSVSRQDPAHHYWPRCAEGSRTAPNSSRGNSVVVSAIRSSLGLDLDEMALHAIEHSVRVLDVTRPCDLMSA